MTSLSEFIAENLCLVFFVNGLAFFVVGLSSALQVRQKSELPLTGHLKLLAAYGFVSSMSNWLQMFMLAQKPAVLTSHSLAANVVKLLLFLLAATFLLFFAIGLITSMDRRYGWLRWSIPILYALYGAVLAIQFAVHGGVPPDWLSIAESTARYFLHTPGLALACVALLAQRQVLLSTKLPPSVALDTRGAALAFALKLVVSGLVAFPILGSASYLASVSAVATQMIRMLSTIGIAIYVVRVVRGFETERVHQVASALEQRLHAQKAALEAQRQARAEVEQWAARLEDVVDAVSSATSNPSGLTEMLELSLAKVLDLAGFDGGDFLLVREGEPRLELVAQIDLSDDMKLCRNDIGCGVGSLGEVHSSSDTVIVRNLAEDPRLQGRPCQEAGFCFLVSIPVTCRGRLLGIMNLLGKCEADLDAHELRMLTAMGQQIGIALENARLYARAESLAVQEERARLGREMHDGLVQVLGLLHLQSQVVRAQIVANRRQAALDGIKQVEDISAQAYDDVRDSIFSLRFALEPGQSVISALQQYVREWGERWDICVDCEGHGRIDTPFPPDTAIQMMRITQEALTNVRKHAGAENVWIRSAVDDQEVSVVVGDDGVGFDPLLTIRTTDQHLGLQTMSERAAGVGGVLQVLSAPGQGTEVRMTLPLRT